MPWLIYPQGNCPQYQLVRRLGGPQRRSRHCGEEKNLAPVWLSSPQPTTILTAIPTPQYTTKVEKYKVQLRYEVFTVVTMKSILFLDVMKCSLAVVYRSFRGTCCLHLQDQRVSPASTKI
jgi:hypothetical protein